MAKEIERKFMVQGDNWKTNKGIRFVQGYLNLDKERTVRVRLAGEQAFITVKGINTGSACAEFEYEIPAFDAQQLLKLCDGPLIEKTRHTVPHAGMIWEIDEFRGANAGLVIAEIELQTAQQNFERPAWLGPEVTADKRYCNSNLAINPYPGWSDQKTAANHFLSPRFEEALIYAVKLHAQQTRKGIGVPYVAHIMGVASIALEYGADENETIAALLHDAIEDQGGDVIRQEIRKRFGEKVVGIVNGCTDSDVQPKPPWKERKVDYIAHLRDGAPSVRLVSAADKLHNAQTILKDYRLVGDAIWERFKGGKEGTLWYYRALVNEFEAAEASPIVDELGRVVHALELLAKETQR